MKKIFRMIALITATALIAVSLCGCSAIVQGFIEGYTEAMNEGNTTTDDDGDVFLFDTDGENEKEEDHSSNDTYDFGESDMDDAAEEIFASNTGNYDNSDIVGKWIDYEDDVINFYSDGSGTYFDSPVEEYRFNGDFLTLIAEGEEYKYPARLYGDTFVIFYEPYYYARVEGNTGSFTGRWESSDDNEYSFEFYSDGTFLEDDEYTGKYYIDGNDILLLYDDTYITYGIFHMHEDGDQLGFAYGWELDRIG